jgi:dTDP-4-dehydrorhamnose 3,5-epimerase
MSRTRTDDAALCDDAAVTKPTIVDFDVRTTTIEGLLVLTMKQITDARGTVRELFRTSAFAEAGLPVGPWPQINATETGHGAIRGLHGENMIKLVAVVSGEAFGAYVDARPGSSSFGRVVTVSLGPGTQVLVPAGVCNGFQSVSPGITQYLYCFTSEWVPGMAGVAVHPLDPALGIDWPIAVDVDDPSQLSAKDAAQPTLAEATST